MMTRRRSHHPGRDDRPCRFLFLVVVVAVGCDSREAVLDDQGGRDAWEAGSGLCPGGWCVIPAGSFVMGSPVDEPCREPLGDKETQHAVTLTRAYEIGQTEITRAQFEAVMGYAPAPEPNWPDPQCLDPRCPATNVTRHEAEACCNALSTSKGLPRCYSCQTSDSVLRCTAAPGYAAGMIYSCPGYRLPTEAEWERAYRAESTSALYNGPLLGSCKGADPNADAIAWYTENSGNGPHPVAGKQPNAWGLHDMAGNVEEYCHDGFEWDLGPAAAVDPWGTAPGGGGPVVVRGGFARSFPQFLRAAVRDDYDVGSRSPLVGFRCGRTLTP